MYRTIYSERIFKTQAEIHIKYIKENKTFSKFHLSYVDEIIFDVE